MSEQEPQALKPKRTTLGNKPSHANSGPKSDNTLSWRIDKCKLVYLFNWQKGQENCAICKNSLSDPCSDCMTRDSYEDCPVVKGTCGHFFHLHCIGKWITKVKTCPICNNTWDFDSS